MSSYYSSENLKLGSEHLRLAIKTQLLENMIQAFGAAAVLTQRKPVATEIKTFNRKEDIYDMLKTSERSYKKQSK